MSNTRKSLGNMFLIRIALLLALPIMLLTHAATTALAQTPTPTPDDRGLGVQSAGSTNSSQAGQQAREAKPELVLQTGYNNFMGATRLVFSPDGRLLATATFRSSTIKLWETATGRELRDLSSGTQSAIGMSPYIAFSRDSRLIAAAAGDNSVRIWDVTSGRELQTLAGSQGSLASSIGVYFIGFTPDGQIVTVSDAIKVWDVATGRELRTLGTTSLSVSGLTGGEGGVSLSPDGKQLANVATDPKPLVTVWDIASGREVRTVDLPDEDIGAVEISFTSDGRLFASGIADKQIKLWDLTARQNERKLGQTSKEYVPVKFSRDGRQLILVEGYTVRRWDTTNGQELPSLKVPNSGLTSGEAGAFVSFSEDGKRVATGGFDTPTILWEAETGKQLLKMNGRTNMAYKVKFNADGTQLYSGGRTRWDLRTGRGLRIAAGPSDRMIGMPSPDGRLIATFTLNSNSVAVLETPSGRQVQTLTPASGGGVVQRAGFSPDGTMLVTTYGADEQQRQKPVVGLGQSAGGIENQAKIWDVKSGRELRTLMLGHSATEVGFSADGHTLAVLGSMGEMSLWDTASGSRLRDLTSSPMANMAALGNIVNMGNMGSQGSMNPGSGSGPGSPRPGSKTPKGMPSMPSMPAGMPNIADITAMMTNMMGTMSAGTMGRSVTSVAFSPDGKILASGGVESKSNFDQMISAQMGQQGQKKSKNQKALDPDDFMKNMKVEAIGQVVLWDVATGRELGALKGHGKGVTQVAFSRDGRLLASSSTDNTIKIWDVATRRELRTLTGHTANIDSMDFSPDSRLLASASDDGGTFLWDTNTGEHLLTLISLDDGGEWMVVTPQGLFDGTPVSWNQILWRYNQDTFNVAPIEWFFNEFYYPGLLADILAGKRPQVSQDVSKKDRRQPTVKLSLTPQPGVATDSATGIAARTVKIRVEVTDAPADKNNSQGSGARDVRLFRNGSLVKVWHGDVLNGQAAVSLEEEVTVAAGMNRLTAYAFNKDNVKSKDAQLPLTGADSLKRAGTAYIIAVGLNEYANAQYNLKYAVADAQSFGDEVRLRQAQLGRFEHIEVVPLLNENATKANIISALKRLAGMPGPPSLKATPFDGLKRAEPEDTVIIYFAGHGTAQAQRFYLIPHDLGYTGERNKLNEQGLRTILAHSISDLELEEAVEGLDAGHLLLVIDACNSGQALEAEEKRRGPMNSKGLAQLAYEKGMYILTAAQSYQAALEAAQLGHGLLTYALVEEGLKTSIADNEPKDGVVNAREWLDFATDRVPQMQEEKMKQGRGIGLEIAFTEGEQNIADPQKRTVQRPRVFYRRELEANPLVIAKP
ncbi:MAG: caspase family protein [Acidobacteriota bacterium]|nr:caspase family protein [Acidobacteriota bacterium]